MNVSGRTVLLTGATGGIGHAQARALAGAGAGVVLSGRRGDVLAGLASEIGGTVAVADLADPQAVRDLVAAHGDADILVANAALPASGALDGFSEQQIDRALAVNLRAPIMLAHALAPRMVARGSGQLVFISSLAGKSATVGASLYSASKFGLRGFAGALRADLHGTGVGVSVIFPGFVSDAGMFADSRAELPRGVGTRTPQQVAAATLKAIERDRGEVDVAPLGLRLGAALAGLAPATSARVTRLAGGERISADVGAGQTDKR